MDKVKVGILFGGSSREREISFAGGRTVYDNLDKSIFEPIPIFVDSKNVLILLDWQYIYKGTIRDFFPPVDYIPSEDAEYQLYIEHVDLSQADYEEAIAKVGRRLSLDEIPQLIDVAFLALHGRTGEDGMIQGLLDFVNVPYTGSDIMASAIGMHKTFQKEWVESSDFAKTSFLEIRRQEWEAGMVNFDQVVDAVGTPIVIRPSHQGSSIGVTILNTPDQEAFDQAINAAFFRKEINIPAYKALSDEDAIAYIKDLIDIRAGIGLPAKLGGTIVNRPSELKARLDSATAQTLWLEAIDSEFSVVCESFIEGMEFSCVVVVDDAGQPFALPPTQIVKGQEVYDYQSKYMPGRSRKVTPIALPTDAIRAIQEECKRLYSALKFKVYARIDGFYATDGQIILNDPNTTSGMLPSSFFFHQAAELGFNPSQFITYILRNSIAERSRYGLVLDRYANKVEQIDALIASQQSDTTIKTRVGVILGGYSFERHISVESGRNIYEKLASSAEYEPIPIFLHGSDESDFRLFHIPINILLKDNSDDIRDSIVGYQIHDVTAQLRQDQSALIQKYTGQSNISSPRDITDSLEDEIDVAFIALHGRPGEDGTIQTLLDAKQIPFNGSDTESSQITIDKYATLQLLKQDGFLVADQYILTKEDYTKDSQWITHVEEAFDYPFIVKPVDDGCSSAVAKIKSRGQLETYLTQLFRDEVEITAEGRLELGLAINEEFPCKNRVLIESLIGDNGADVFMEVTGGMLYHQEGEVETIEIFEPSEVLAGEEILSLEEKFLAGQGQNITPARFDQGELSYETVAEEVKSTLKAAAQLLKVKGYCRIDAFVRIYNSGKVETIIIEINSLPGMTPATCIFHQCAINNYKPYHFIDKILKFGIERKTQQLTTV